ncbi:RrF2 family transcriptional regulator [Thermodesulfatator atlanticus]|uniref:RrF2 family transcriptional regulator n=1 Tax=Thermodesulfatator atlanticus TaxID=501497 RepID=UPI0003B6DF82|nr:Rrf2 family transcriptional regulator [Thermodesulfatator atlanticus]
MKISRATDYGIRLVVYLAEKSPKIVPRSEVAKEMEVPAEFLAKIAQHLARAGLIEIKQGRGGGYKLKRNPKEITLLEIVEALEGEICLNVCVENPDACNFSSRCKVHLVWEAARDGLRRLLGSIPVAELVFKTKTT